ncbi:putative RNA-directed DNA polymerase [Tanacetum coccineum]
MAASSFSSNETLFSMNTLLHMMIIKLTSNNYLLWRNHMLPIFTYQKQIGHINGTSTTPSSTIIVDGKTMPNHVVVPWNEVNQRAIILLQSSLTKESAAKVLGLTTASQIWLSLEAAYGNASVERVNSLRDSIHQITEGTSFVSDYCRCFKAICNQLLAIGHHIVEIEKLHWFLCGLGPSYETFSTAIRATKLTPLFCKLATKAKSHELFMISLHGTSTPLGTSSRGRGRGQNRHPPHCQLCHTNGHYASACLSLATNTTQASTTDESVAKAFHAQCHVTTKSLDWHVDLGATDHMTSSCDSLNHAAPYKGNANVLFRNGKTLPITHKGSSIICNNIPLRNVLVIPNLTKKLLSDRNTKKVLTSGKCENGLYVLKDEHRAFVATTTISKKASYELWHNRLGDGDDGEGGDGGVVVAAEVVTSGCCRSRWWGWRWWGGCRGVVMMSDLWWCRGVVSGSVGWR